MYTSIDARFWTDQIIKKLPEDSRVLMFYFLTAPLRNLIGFFAAPEPVIIHYVQWDSARYLKARVKLIETERIFVDDNAEVILINNFLKWNPLKNSNCEKSAARLISEMPDTPLFKNFLSSLKKLNKYEELQNAVQTRIEELSAFENTPFIKQPIAEKTTIKITETKEPPAKVKEFVFVFNETLGDVLPKVREITKDRINKITEIIKRFGREDVARVFSNIKDSDFLCGKIKGNSWKCSFDWMIQEKIFVKILEGTYNNNNAKSLPRAFQDIEDAMNGVGEGEITEYDQR